MRRLAPSLVHRGSGRPRCRPGRADASGAGASREPGVRYSTLGKETEMIGAQERHAEPSHEASQARSRLATHPAVLWQFRNSHFNEKVRWALDWKRVPHLRRSLVPGLHIGRALWMTGKKQVPVLSVDGQVTADLTAAALLYPLVLPPEAPYRLDRPIPPAAAEMRGSFAAHPAFTWAAGMYRRHRGTSAEVAGR